LKRQRKKERKKKKGTETTMVSFILPGSIWAQLSNFFFLSSGLFNDLLVIRMSLTLAYTFLFICGVLGLPSWDESFTGWDGKIAVDIIIWSIVNIVVVHGSGVVRMYYDERRIEALTDDQEKLWRYIYRHSGLSKAQFKHLIVPTLKLLTFEEGESIPILDNFYVILDGMIKADVAHLETPDATHAKVKMFSGAMFPLVHMYLDYMPRQNFFGRSAMICVASSKQVRVYVIPVKTLRALAVHPDARDCWIAMIIAALAVIAERPYKDTNTDSFLTSEIDSLFDPLHPSEEPEPLLAGSGTGLSRPFAHMWRYIQLSFYLPWPIGHWPVGLRHALRPPHDPDISKKTEQRLSAFCNRSEGLSRVNEVWEKQGPEPSGEEELSTTAISKTMISNSTKDLESQRKQDTAGDN
jgi:hypothetical protein